MMCTDAFITGRQTRDGYIGEYISNIWSLWTLMDDNEGQPIYDPILQFDFPEKLETTIDYRTRTGFRVHKMTQPDKWHAMLLLSK